MGFLGDYGEAWKSPKKAKDLLFGKKDKGTDPSVLKGPKEQRQKLTRARQGQTRAANLFGDNLSELKDGRENERDVRNQIQREKSLFAQKAKDDEMRARDLVARRGMGNSAAGLRTILNADENARSAMVQRQSAIPSEVRARRLDEILKNTQGLNSIIGATTDHGWVHKQGTPGKGRGGGLFDIAATAGGAALGYSLGGPMGASIGANLGRSTAGTMRGMG